MTIAKLFETALIQSVEQVTFKQDYYGVKAISNSSLSKINPLEGGNPRKFMNFLEEEVTNEKKSLSLERGTLIHKFLESPDEFYISDVVEPTEMMKNWVDAVYLKCKDKENFMFKDYVVNIKNELGVYKTTKDATKVYEMFMRDGINYFDYLVKASGKHLMSTATKTILSNIISKVDNIPFVSNIVRAGMGEFDSHLEVHNELDVFFKVQIHNLFYYLKFRLDKVIINHEDKVIKLTDYKTTGFSAYSLGVKEEKTYTLKNSLEEVRIIDTQGSFYKYRYHRQIAAYTFAITHYFKDLIDKGYSIALPLILAIETTTKENNIVPILITESTLADGFKEYLELVERVCWHTEQNEWDYPREGITITI